MWKLLRAISSVDLTDDAAGVTALGSIVLLGSEVSVEFEFVT
jgi:hypothetical protein